MPMRALPDGTYLLKPPNWSLQVIISKPGGAVLYSAKNKTNLPITLSTAVTTGHYAYLKVHP